MSYEQETLLENLYKFLKTQGYRPKPIDSSGKINLAKYASIIEFSFIKDGINYGTARLSIDNADQLIVYTNDDVENSPGGKSDDGSMSWTQLLKYLRDFTFGRLEFVLKDEDDWEYDMALRKDNEKLDEGYHPINKNTSYSDAVPDVKIRIQHSKNIGEGEQRYRNVARIFIENANGERFMLETKKPGIARVFARHVAEGGRPYDEKWNHINSLVEDYTKMAGFVRATKNGQFNESTQTLVNEGVNHYMGLRETLHKLAGKKGYGNYFESWTPTLNEDSESADLSEMFISSSLDPRIESAMPILAKLSRTVTEVTEMAEVTELAEWASNIIGEDLTPTGKVQVEKIVELLSDSLPVGPDATNVLPQLSDLNLVDSELTEILKDLAEQDSDADAVPVIKDWMESSNDHKLHSIVNQLNGKAQSVEEDFDNETSISSYSTGTAQQKTQPGQTASDYESKTFARNPATGAGSYMIQKEKDGVASTDFQKNVSKPWMDYTEKGGQAPMSKFKATPSVTEGPKEIMKLGKFVKGGGTFKSPKQQGVAEGSESSIQKKIQSKQDSLSLAREQRRAKGQRQQGQREIKLQTEIDRLNTELTQLKKQGVAEGSLNESDKFTSWYDWKDQAKSSGYTITKKDDKIVALNKQGQVVGHWSDVGKFLSGKAPRPNFKRPVEQGVAEGGIKVQPGLRKAGRQTGYGTGPTDSDTLANIPRKPQKDEKPNKYAALHAFGEKMKEKYPHLRDNDDDITESTDPLIAIRRLSGFEK